MCADRDSTSSPGFRALLGRFLHGLLQYRVFQLLGAAWSYLMGLAGASFFSILPSTWLVHRSVSPDELPEMLEALGLRSGPWEELEECLEELGPWKELLSPAMKSDLEIMSPWKGYVSSSEKQKSWDTALEELGTWHSKMLSTWKDLVDPDQEEDECHSKSSFSYHNIQKESGQCDVECEKKPHSSSVGMVSCIFNPGSGGVFTWLDLGSESNLQSKEVLDETSSQEESKDEIEHIRNKRLWFLQQNHGQDVPTTELKQEEPTQIQQNILVLNDAPALTELELPVSGWHDEQDQNVCLGSLSYVDIDQTSGKEPPSTDPDSRPCHALSLLVSKPCILGNTQNQYPPSPDQDQGYHSLEDWQCLNIKQNLQSEDISPSEIHEPMWNSDGAHVPPELSCYVEKGLKTDQDSATMDSDPEEEIHAPALPVCTNKHIGYILGTVVSDDEEDPSSSCEDDDWDEDCDDDDGFDSEGSISASEREDVVLLNSFCSADPYNPQNFTASLQTGPVLEVNSHLEDQAAVISDDEESWLDSDAVSDSDSEDEFIADEQENVKLWNGFLKSEDPYNPLFFRASVQTSVQKRPSTEASTKHIEVICMSSSSCELTVSSHPSDSPLSRLRKVHGVSMEESANVGHKKVTFFDQVTVYYICNEEERKGHWEEFARDRCRFQRRIQETESVIGHCFTPDHRHRVWNRMHEIWGS